MQGSLSLVLTCPMLVSSGPIQMISISFYQVGQGLRDLSRVLKPGLSKCFSLAGAPLFIRSYVCHRRPHPLPRCPRLIKHWRGSKELRSLLDALFQTRQPSLSWVLPSPSILFMMNKKFEIFRMKVRSTTCMYKR